MKFTLRLTLTTTLVGLILLTVAALGLTGRRNFRFTTDDLSSQILDETSKHVDSEINLLLTIGSRQGHLNEVLIRERQFDPGNFEKLARFWLSVLETHPRISRQSYGVEATGDWSLIRRLGSGKLAIGELRLNPKTGKHEWKDYWPEKYPSEHFNFFPDADDKDPRKHHWYTLAKAAGHQVWSRTYILDDIEGFSHVPGVSCSTPVYGKNGTLEGVLTTSFDVIALSEYLATLKVGKGGFAFVVEIRDDGRRQVIAHPRPEILIRKAGKKGNEEFSELVPTEDLHDSRAATFLNQVPSNLDPATSQQAKRVGFTHEGISYVGNYRCLSTPGGPNWLICMTMPEEDVMARVNQNTRDSAVIGLIILIIALMAGLFVSTQVARPLERVVKQTEKIGRFEVEARPVAHSMIVEVDRLACVVEETKTNLRSFGKYVPTDVIHQLFATGQEATLGGERRRLTVSFCDLANFTTLAEKLPPEELVLQMSDYFARFSADIVAEKGTVDKYIGDAIMAFWGAPTPSSDHAVAACLTALRNQKTIEELRLKWRSEGKPELTARIGIMTGDAVVGNVGSDARLNYTAMGDTVNMASRLEGLGKYYGTKTLIGEPTYLEVQEIMIARAVDRVSVKGKSEGMMIYELLALRDQAEPGLEKLASLAEQALRAYQDREWHEALTIFEEILQLHPGDGPANVLADRCRGFLESPPSDDWDGVHRMVSK